MRIALLANPDNIHVRRWAEFLRNQGHDLLLIADPHTSGSIAGIQTQRPQWNLASNILAFKLTPRPHGNAIWKYLHYRPMLKFFRPDVVHAFEAYYSGLAMAWGGNFPKVLTPWGKDVHHDAFQGTIWNWIVRTSLRAANRITTNDPTMPEFLERRFNIPREKTSAFSWGVDLSVFRSGRSEGAAKWRKELGIPDSAPVILSPRKFHPYWGCERILEAWPKVVAACPEAHLIVLAPDDICGLIPDAKLKAVSAGRPVANSIHWIERPISSDEMADLFNLARAFVSVPQDDLLAMTVLEGMACGCYPVLANLPAYAIHAPLDTSNGMNATMVSPADDLSRAMIEASEDNPSLTAAKAFNRERMTRMEDSKINMAKIEDVYAQAIADFHK